MLEAVNDREVRLEIDIVEFIFTINRLKVQRVDVLENIKRFKKQLIREKRSLGRKEKNSNNSKKNLAKIQKIENKIENSYTDYMNQCISMVMKSNPTSVVIIENSRSHPQKYDEFVTKIKVRCRIHGIEFKTVKTYA